MIEPPRETMPVLEALRAQCPTPVFKQRQGVFPDFFDLARCPDFANSPQ
jgi:hypothetical protein